MGGGRSAAPLADLPMRLVASTGSPFESVGASAQSGNLECVTASVCYAAQSSPTTPGWTIDRTADGGETWLPVATLPNHELLTWPLSCPTALDCFGAASSLGNEVSAPASPQLAVTTDGGQHWSIDQVTAPSDFQESSVDQMSCPTAQSCVIHLLQGLQGTSAASGTFLSTNDGGRTWTAASLVPPSASVSLWSLKCDSDGSCIGLVPTGSVADPDAEAIDALRSTDGGHTWTVTSVHLAVGPGTLLLSCGDSLHCLAAYNANNGTTIGIATTSDGGATWKVNVAPASWPNTAIAVSCATPLDCFVSASGATNAGYADPVIEATHDGGLTWTPLSLPDVAGSPLAIVYPLSCPVPSGCIGVGATPQEFAPPRTLPKPGFVAASQGRVIVSNLRGSE